MRAFGRVASARARLREPRDRRQPQQRGLGDRRHDVRHNRVQPSVHGVRRRGAQSGGPETVHETGGAQSRVPQLRVAGENVLRIKKQIKNPRKFYRLELIVLRTDRIVFKLFYVSGFVAIPT